MSQRGAAAGGQSRDSEELWAAWMLRAQDGDREAYRALLGEIAPYLRAIARRYMGRGEDAEDAVQEILLVVHDIRHTYERGRPFKPWLNTIATRRCIDLLRRRSRRLEVELAEDGAFLQEHVPEDSPGPEDSAARFHEARTVHQAVSSLSPRQQEAVRLVHLGGLSLNEASARSQQSVGSLKVACHRALKTLQKTLKGNGHGHD